MRSTVARAAMLFGILIPIAACADAVPSGPPSAAPSLVETPASPAQPIAPSTSPVATSPPAASATPVAWTELERTIRAGIREDAAEGCVPRRHELPPGTIAAVECRPGDAAVARVGFYLFASPDQAFDHYRNRIRDERLTYNDDDDSRFGSRWERCWYDFGEGEQKQLDCRQRDAGFVNSEGYANYRAIDGALYIGVLGNNADVADLYDWSARLDSGDPPPGEMAPVPNEPTLYEGELVSREA